MLLATQVLSWSAAETAENLSMTVASVNSALQRARRWRRAVGRDSIATWMLGPGIGCKGARLVRLSACGGMPAFAQYREGGEQPWAIIVLELRGDRIAGVTTYLDVQTLFPRFGMLMRLA